MVIAGIPCTMPAIWIGLIVIFLIVEGLTAGLVTIWFAVGALAALIAVGVHYNNRINTLSTQVNDLRSQLYNCLLYTSPSPRDS